MAAQPGRIVREWRVDLPRPREEQGEALLKLRFEILAALRRDAFSTASPLLPHHHKQHG